MPRRGFSVSQTGHATDVKNHQKNCAITQFQSDDRRSNFSSESAVWILTEQAGFASNFDHALAESTCWVIYSSICNRRVILSLVSHRCLSVMSSISVFERVKSALNSNDVQTLRTSCRVVSTQVTTEEHSKATRSSSSFLGRNFGAK